MSQPFKTPQQKQAERRAEILHKKEEDALRKQRLKQQRKEFIVWSFGAILINILIAGGLFMILYYFC